MSSSDRSGPMPSSILIVEDNRKLSGIFKEALSEYFEVGQAYSLRQARTMLKDFDGCLLDLQLPDGEGLELIGPFKRARPLSVIIVVTAYGTVSKAVEAIKSGATDFLEKPVDLEQLVGRFRDLMAVQRGDDMVAESSLMRETLTMAERVAPTAFPVLITGETGTGKEVLARYIHKRSGRERFISLNCANLPSEIADSMLFGHLKGSFTGASECRQGLVEAADEGTLFLDEIGDLPMSLQPKILRFLDSGAYLPIGGTREAHSSARILAATNKDLKKEVSEGRFREDLYFRLSAFPIRVPPLRKRREDILPLARLHLARLGRQIERDVDICEDALAILQSCNLPGNVRELFNLLDRAFLLCNGSITSRDISGLLDGGVRDDSSNDFWSQTRASAIEKERELIAKALAEAGGNKAKAARILGVSYKTLLKKMKRLDI